MPRESRFNMGMGMGMGFGMMMKWILRELWNNKKFSFFYMTNLTFGLLGLLLLSTLQNSFEKATFLKAKEILSADFSIYARRVLGEKELQNLFTSTSIPWGFETSRRIGLYTMVRKSSEGESKL